MIPPELAALRSGHAVRARSHSVLDHVLAGNSPHFTVDEARLPAVADYVAELLTEFSREERTRCVLRGQLQPMDYFFEMLTALQTAPTPESFAEITDTNLCLSTPFCSYEEG